MADDATRLELGSLQLSEYKGSCMMMIIIIYTWASDRLQCAWETEITKFLHDADVTGR